MPKNFQRSLGRLLRNVFLTRPKRVDRVATTGFTLIELLVVIAIIGFLASIILVNLNSARLNSQAVHIASDLRAITIAFEDMQGDIGRDYQPEDVYGLVNAEAPCNDEPILSVTDIFQNISAVPAWKGPYLQGVPRDPFGREYAYDNDEDVWDPGTNKWGGVNIQLMWCAGEAGRYLVLAPLIDNIYDAGDGPDAGRFRWDNAATGGYGIIVAASSSS